MSAFRVCDGLTFRNTIFFVSGKENQLLGISAETKLLGYISIYFTLFSQPTSLLCFLNNNIHHFPECVSILGTLPHHPAVVSILDHGLLMLRSVYFYFFYNGFHSLGLSVQSSVYVMKLHCCCSGNILMPRHTVNIWPVTQRMGKKFTNTPQKKRFVKYSRSLFKCNVYPSVYFI